MARCVNEANDVSDDNGHRIYFSTKTEGKEYQIVFNVRSVSTSGHVYADAKLITPSGVATFTNLSGNGGMYGSFMNLMGDGFHLEERLIGLLVGIRFLFLSERHPDSY